MPDLSFLTNFFSSTKYAEDARSYAKIRSDYEMVKSGHFSSQTQAHLDLLVNSNNLLIKKRDALQNLDRQIIGGLAIGIAASAVSFFLPLSLLATGAYIYSIYCLGSRSQAQQEYYAALENLVDCCKWSLLKSPTDLKVLENDAIKGMIASLAAPTTNEQLSSFVNPSIANAVCDLADKAENESMLQTFGKTLDNDQTSAYQSMYGYEKGSLLDAAKTLFYFARQAFMWAKKKCTSDNVPPTEDQNNNEPNLEAAASAKMK